MRPAAFFRLSRSAWALAVLAGLGACSSGGEPDTVGRAASIAAGAAAELLGLGPEPAPRQALTRAQINAFPAALIGVQRVGDDRTYFGAYSVNNGRVVYYNPGGQSLTLHGAALASTHALGVDLAGYRSDPAEDPLVRPRPPQAWPEVLTRVYRFHDAFGDVYSRSFLCRPQVAGPERAEIAELTFDLVRIEELCRSTSDAFVNRYWVDGATGFVWRSEQWGGPEVGSLTIEVLRPFAERSEAAGE